MNSNHYSITDGTLTIGAREASDAELGEILSSIEPEQKAEITNLVLKNLINITTLPDSVAQFPALQSVDLTGCMHLQSVANLNGLPVHTIIAQGTGLRTLDSLKGLKITRLVLDDCLSLKSLSALADLKDSLQDLSVKNLAKLRSTKSIEPLKNLSVLTISGSGIPGGTQIDWVKKVIH